MFMLQESVVSMSSLFFGIITHKALVAFSVGMNLTKSLHRNRKLVVLLVVLISSFSPIGGVIGILIEVGVGGKTQREII